MQEKLQALKQAGSEGWKKLKPELDGLLTELRHEFDQARVIDYRAGVKSIGWAEGIAKEQIVKSIGWAEGIAKENPLQSIGVGAGDCQGKIPLSLSAGGEGYAHK